MMAIDAYRIIVIFDLVIVQLARFNSSKVPRDDIRARARDNTLLSVVDAGVESRGCKRNIRLHPCD